MSIEEWRILLDERDRRYTERFDAQEKATDAALAAQKEAIAAALNAAQTAVTKAEVASEKRFDSVNEFRAQQGDLIRTFVQRREAFAVLGIIVSLYGGLIVVVLTHH